MDGRLQSPSALANDDGFDRGGSADAVRLLASIVESSDDAIVARDLDGTVRAWNAGAERVLGYPAAEMIGSPIAPVWREDRELYERMQAELAAGEHVPTFEARAVRGDGTVIDVSVTATPIDAADGEVSGVSVIFRDITQRRASDAAARRLQALVESSEDAIVDADLDGTVSQWNRAAEGLYGYSAEEMIGESIGRVHPEGHIDFRDVNAALEAGDRGRTFETRELAKDGSLIDVSVSLSPIAGASGEIVGVSYIVRDIGAGKRAAREADEATRRFERAFAGAPIGMAIVALDGRWMAVNAALCRMLDRSEADLLGMTPESLTHPDDREEWLDRRARAQGGDAEAANAERRYLRPDGAPLWARESNSLVGDEEAGRLYYVTQIQDITAEKDAEDELLRYSAHLADLALQDPLTGLRNYRDFHALLDTEVERSRRHGDVWSVVLMDIDGFGAINEAEGQFEGDRILREAGAAVAGAARASDLAARIGGDEFGLVLTQTAGADAERTAERIAAAVAATPEGVTVSYGIASWPADGKSKQALLLRADTRLRASKPEEAGEVGHARDDGAVGGLQRILTLARKQLEMDVAYVAELDEHRQVFQAIAGDPKPFGVAEGDQLPAEATYCRLMLAGSVPSAIPDTALEPRVASLPITKEAGVGSYVGVPLELSDGRLYGTLCAVSREPTPELSQRQVDLMRFLAELVAHQIEHDEREADVRRTHAELAGIHALLSALLARDHYTGEHSQTVVRLGIAVARQLQLDEPDVLEVEQVALLHDIGKVGIPDSVLQKRGPLNDREWELMLQHPVIGARILAGTETLAHLAPAVRAEHERYDGGGYPDGLRGEEIPLASRITFACDAYHAMTSDRPYRAALPEQEAAGELRRCAGSQFDPTVVDALLSSIALGQYA